MAHEKAIKEAKKALDLGYSESEAAKLLKARGLDKDEIKKELPSIKAHHIAKEHEKAKRAAAKSQSHEAKTAATTSTQKSVPWFWLLAVLALVILILFYLGVLNAEIFT